MYLFLIRHGQSEGNVAGRLQGWQDAPLTALGERQAERTAAALRVFLERAEVAVAAIYSSPLQRALRTAGAIGQALDRPVIAEPGLREMHFGAIEGLTEAEWHAGYPEVHAAAQVRDDLDFGWPGGETRRAFYARIGGAFAGILARHAAHEHLVLVSHGGVIGSYLSHLTTGTWHHWSRFVIGNCSITHLTLEPGAGHMPAVSCLLTLNDTGHLDADDVAALAGSV